MLADEEEDERPERDELGRKLLYSDIPEKRSDVVYAIDRETALTAERVRRLNDLGSLGVLEVRAKYAKLVAERAMTEYDLAKLIDTSPWLVAAPGTPKTSFRTYALVALAALLVVIVVIGAARRSPTLSAQGAPEAPPVAAESGIPPAGEGDGPPPDPRDIR